MLTGIFNTYYYQTGLVLDARIQARATQSLYLEKANHKLTNKKCSKLRVVAQTYNPSTLDLETGRMQIPDQPGLHSNSRPTWYNQD